jgi:two-component system chemotaxis response regulator CheB
MARKIAVMIIDDSTSMRAQIGAILRREPDIEVVGSAQDPTIAARSIAQLNPDVLTLDIQMPRMDGLTFLKKLMASRPMPVVMVSSHTQKGADICMDALRLGAVSVVGKPLGGAPGDAQEFATALVQEVRAAAACRRIRRPSATVTAAPLPPTFRPTAAAAARPVLIGASTGGTDALRTVLARLPADAPPIAIAQHMPMGFTAYFATHLDERCAIAVKEAQDGDLLEPGLALLAPGDSHMSVAGGSSTPRVTVRPGPRIDNHRPSVDTLFESAARILGPNAVGVILSGMGDDGARGMRSLQEAGAATIGQDEPTCVIYGMSRAAALLGALDRELPIERIPHAIVQAAAAVMATADRE